MSRTTLLALLSTIGCTFSGKGVADQPDGGGPNDPDARPIDGATDGSVDAPFNAPAPVLIPGGGVRGGAIFGVVNVYVIDQVSGQGIAGASVTIGSIAGTTDATGLFVATTNTLAGKQSVLAIANGYRAEYWVGVNGANVTVPLRPVPLPVVPRADVVGTFTNITSIPITTGHYRLGFVTYSASDTAGDAANNLDTAGNANFCTTPPGSTCDFAVTSRTGPVALIGTILEVDPNGPGGSDDVVTFLTWAYRTGITVVSGTAQTGQNLTIVARNSLQTATVAFGTPPASLQRTSGYIGFELGDEGVAQLPLPATPASPTLQVPPLATFPGATLRLTGIARGDSGASSIVIRRGFTGLTLDAGTWLTPPASIVPSRTMPSWVVDANTDIATFMVRDIIEVMVFDGTTSVAIPAAVNVPGGGREGSVGSLGGSLDVTNFGFVEQLEQFTEFATTPVTVQ
ncbi:MAG: hypothetical protein H0T79_03715 [Deltaproteobacteria bacterium]|nr:hypothetical protein [Deltaproteobacteria bacterium]